MTYLLTAVLALRAVDECLWFALLVGLLTLLAYATYSIGNDLRLQGQSNAIKAMATKRSYNSHKTLWSWASNSNILIRLNFRSSVMAIGFKQCTVT